MEKASLASFHLLAGRYARVGLFKMALYLRNFPLPLVSIAGMQISGSLMVAQRRQTSLEAPPSLGSPASLSLRRW